MDSLIRDFKAAFAGMKGDQLAETLRPDVQLNSTKLLSIYGEGNIEDAEADLRYFLDTDPSRPRLSREEANGWYEIYLAYWCALGEILAVEGLRDAKVSS